jgi:hypothetical protein
MTQEGGWKWNIQKFKLLCSYLLHVITPVAYANEEHKTADASIASHCDSLLHIKKKTDNRGMTEH